MKKYLVVIIMFILLIPFNVFAESKDLYAELKAELTENSQLEKIDDDIYLVKGSGDDGAINNYIMFNEELWRVVGIYNGQLKIIRATDIGYHSFDSTGYIIRYQDSTLGAYLNGDYFDSLNETSQSYIDENGTWYIGKLTNEEIATEAYQKAKQTTWNGKVGLLATYEYYYASIGENCHNLNFIGNYSCGKAENDWLGSIETWTLSPYFYDDAETRGVPLGLNGSGWVDAGCSQYCSRTIHPTVYLKSNIKITSGTGTSTDPYKIDLYQPHAITIESNNQTNSVVVDVDDLSEVDYKEPVVFRVSPIDGYEISKVTILDEEENEIECEQTENAGEYKFVMPNKAVKIIPTYKEIEVITEPEEEIINPQTFDYSIIYYLILFISISSLVILKKLG